MSQQPNRIVRYSSTRVGSTLVCLLLVCYSTSHLCFFGSVREDGWWWWWWDSVEPALVALLAILASHSARPRPPVFRILILHIFQHTIFHLISHPCLSGERLCRGFVRRNWPHGWWEGDGTVAVRFQSTSDEGFRQSFDQHLLKVTG